MAVKKVEAIVPTEMIQSVKEGKDPIDAVVETAENVSLSRKEKKANAKFEKLRFNLMLEGLGVDRETYNSFQTDYQNAEAGDSHLKDDRVSRLKMKQSIYKGQKGANKNDFKDTLKEGIINGGSAAIKIAAGVSATIAAVVEAAALAPIAVASTIVGVIYSTYRYNKRKKGNYNDEYDKQNAYQEELFKFIEDSKKLEEAIVKDRDLLEEAKRTMSRKEFKAYKEAYLTKKINEFGIQSPFQEDEEVKVSLAERAGAIFKGEGKPALAEVGA